MFAYGIILSLKVSEARDPVVGDFKLPLGLRPEHNREPVPSP